MEGMCRENGKLGNFIKVVCSDFVIVVDLLCLYNLFFKELVEIIQVFSGDLLVVLL